jgi:hypothetical protein
MDLEDWEFLPDHGFIDYHEDYPRKSKRNYNNNINNMFNMDHFKCPSSSSPQGVITVPFHLEQLDDELEKKKHVITKLPLEVNLAPPPSVDLEKKKKIKIESFDQVFFKKMKENEFVDMKQPLLDSPNSRVLLPQIENLKFDDDDDAKSTKVESITEMKKNELVDAKTDDVEEENSNGNMNFWKMSLTGIGAICSFGVAAATICIIVLGSHRRNTHNQKFHFQIYTDDKQRIKQVVHHATKLNEAISSVRGVPVTRAHISFGGYYDAI